jgi:hypothetical protein
MFKTKIQTIAFETLTNGQLEFVSGGTYEQCVSKCVSETKNQTPLTEPICRIECSPK